jgi:ABC-type amino acid transport substrate-binding protein
VADDLDRFLDGRPIEARPVTPLQRGWRWCRRNPILAGLLAVAATLSLLVVVLVFLLLEPKPGTRPDGSLQRVQRAGKLVIATDPTYPPMEFRRDGELMGFDIAFARELANRLGVQAEFMPVDWSWPDLTRRLDSHEFDMLLSTITITEERKQQVDFVAYMPLPLVFVCRQGVKVGTERDLAGKVVAVQADTTAAKLVEQQRRRGVDVKQVLVFPSSTDPFEALQKGMAEVTLAHKPVAEYLSVASQTLVEILVADTQALETLPDIGDGQRFRLVAERVPGRLIALLRVSL